MINLISRGAIQDPAVQREFEHLVMRLRGFLSQSFDEDGELIVVDPNLAVMPVGGLAPYAGTTAPRGWLLCDGAQLSRVTHKALFDVIGVAYGSGDGSTTFNLPDMRQRYPMGKAASGTGATLGGTFGAIDHDHSVTAEGDHAHDVSSHSHGIDSDGDHNHGGTAANHQHGLTDLQTAATGTSGGFSIFYEAGSTEAFVAAGNHAHFTHAPGAPVLSTDGVAPTITTGGSHNHGGSTNGATSDTTEDGGHDHGGVTGSANPPTLVMNYIIFAGV